MSSMSKAIIAKRRVGENRKQHPLYKTYAGMKRRCYNQNEKAFGHYGGRGIKICDRWLGLDGFNHFVADMGSKPSQKHSIDRIDNDGNYEPSNCRWATPKEQRQNQRLRIDNKAGIGGISWYSARGNWRVKVESVYIGCYSTLEEALSALFSAKEV